MSEYDGFDQAEPEIRFEKVGWAMRKVFFAILSSAAIYVACGASTYAADYAGVGQPSFGPRPPKQQSIWIRAGGDCGRHLCALDTSIFSLYGSYGPRRRPDILGRLHQCGLGLLTDIPRMTSGTSPNLRPFGIFDKPEALPSIVDGGRSRPTPRRAPKMFSFQSSGADGGVCDGA